MIHGRIRGRRILTAAFTKVPSKLATSALHMPFSVHNLTGGNLKNFQNTWGTDITIQNLEDFFVTKAKV